MTYFIVVSLHVKIFMIILKELNYILFTFQSDEIEKLLVIYCIQISLTFRNCNVLFPIIQCNINPIKI